MVTPPRERPLIALAQRGILPDTTRRITWQARAYAEAIEAAGGIVVTLPLTADLDALRRVFDLCDGLVVAGGRDIEPTNYGEEPEQGAPLLLEPEVDAQDLALIKWAIEKQLPTLAICRGMQALNVFRGGSLIQDLSAEPKAHHLPPPGETIQHDVVIEPASKLGALVGAFAVGGRIVVNSRHHQVIRRLGKGVRVVGRSDDGLVEAVELDGHRFFLGVQWHPETLAPQDPGAAALFAGLVAAVREVKPPARHIARRPRPLRGGGPAMPHSPDGLLGSHPK